MAQFLRYHHQQCQILTWLLRHQMVNQLDLNRFTPMEYLKRIQDVRTTTIHMMPKPLYHLILQMPCICPYPHKDYQMEMLHCHMLLIQGCNPIQELVRNYNIYNLLSFHIYCVHTYCMSYRYIIRFFIIVFVYINVLYNVLKFTLSKRIHAYNCPYSAIDFISGST